MQLAASRELAFDILEAQSLGQLALVEVLAGDVDAAWCAFAARALLDEGGPRTALRLLRASAAIRDELHLVSWPRFAPVQAAMLVEATAAAGDQAAALPSSVGPCALMDAVLAPRTVPDASAAHTPVDALTDTSPTASRIVSVSARKASAPICRKIRQAAAR